MCPLRRIYMAYNETPTKGNVMNKIDFAKRVNHVATNIAASKVVAKVVNRVTTPNTTTVVKIVVLVGGVVASAIVADTMQKALDTKIDEIAEKFKKKN